MNHKKVYQKRLQSLDKGKAKSLGPVEKLTMRYAGWVDGKHGLLRCSQNGDWQSSVLKQEVDSYEEFCAGQMGRLKFEEEDEFKKLNILFDTVVPLKTNLTAAKQVLKNALAEDVDLTRRKEGEESLTEVQVAARRNREREESLLPFKRAVAESEKALSDTIEAIFTSLSQVTESFDSAAKITNRVLQHHQRRIDVYWRSAMRHVPDLPALPNVTFTNNSEQEFSKHYQQVVQRAEKLRLALASELQEEVL